MELKRFSVTLHGCTQTNVTWPQLIDQYGGGEESAHLNFNVAQIASLEIGTCYEDWTAHGLFRVERTR